MSDYSRQQIIDLLASEPNNELAGERLGLPHYHVARLRDQQEMTPIARQMNDHGEDVVIEMMDPGVRLYSCLKRSGIHTVRQLLERSWLQIASVPNLGPRGMRELASLLAMHELELAPASLTPHAGPALVQSLPAQTSGQSVRPVS